MTDILSALVQLAYLAAALMFVLGLKRLTSVKTARKANLLSAGGMTVAVLATLADIALHGELGLGYIAAGLAVGSLIGWVWAMKVEMTAMPQMVAIFNGFGGAASALVAISVFWKDVVEPGSSGTMLDLMRADIAITMALSVLVGGVTFTGSTIAFAKLQELMKGAPILFKGQQALNALLFAAALAAVAAFCATPVPGPAMLSYMALLALSLLLGVLLVIPIGGADMPVVISLLNSYSGIAAGMSGFVLQNNLLIISGALVGASGIIMTAIMCKAMNRSLANVVFGGFGAEAGTGDTSEYKNVKSYGPEEAAMVFEAAASVVIVPGYGLAVAQAQHEVRELASLLQKRGATVRYGIHPVAGRMPGHMNVLLAEANIPYEQLLDMDEINPEFPQTDVVLVLGANDVVNPAAIDQKDSPIYGMPILEVYKANTVFIVKRSLASGFAGIKNALFERDNAYMIFGDAKKVLKDLVNEAKEWS